MELTPEQIEEARCRCESIGRADEGGLVYLLLGGLKLPESCSPSILDGLLCTGTRDGYNTRLFLNHKPTGPLGLNWNADGIRILDRQWWAFSWRVPADRLRLIEVIDEHLRPLRQ